MKFKMIGEVGEAIEAELKIIYEDTLRLYLNGEHVISIDKQGLRKWKVSDSLLVPKNEHGQISTIT